LAGIAREGERVTCVTAEAGKKTWRRW
jgi:hypothetical protein